VIPEPDSDAPELAPVRQPSWGYNDLLIFVFMTTLLVGAGQVAMGLLLRVFHLNTRDLMITFVPSQLLLYAVAFGVLFAILKLEYGRGFWLALAWNRFSVSPAMMIFLGLVLAFLNGAASLLLRTPDLDTPIKHLFDHRLTAFEFCLIATTLGPLCEELVFRGFMQPVIVRSVGPALGILVTALLFGSVHLAQNGFAWQSGLLITTAGVAFGWVRHLTNSTRASTLMHVGYNLTFFVAVLGQQGNIPAK
jgi:membrane protease YdiL (CAAX protease family)